MKYGASAFAAIIVFLAGTVGPSVAMEKKVSTRTVNWNNPAQVEALYDRLEQAAKAMCSSTGAPRQEILHCVDMTLDAAAQESGKPELIAYHKLHGPSAPHHSISWK